MRGRDDGRRPPGRLPPRGAFALPGPARVVACVLLAAAALAAPACAVESASAAARTHYESLDMSSPDASARRFAQAWAAQDFMTVYLLLSPQSAHDVARAIDGYEPHRIVPGFDEADARDLPSGRTSGQTIEEILAGASPNGEFDGDPTRRFDALLRQAAARGKLPFALTARTQVDAGKGDGAQVLVALRTPGADTLTLSILRQPSGRWKVDRVRWPGSDATARPWDGAAGPAQGAQAAPAPPDDAGRPRTFYEALDMSSPDAAVRTFVGAWTRRDYLSVHHLLSPDAEWGASRAIEGLRFEALAPGLGLRELGGTLPWLAEPRSDEEVAADVTPFNEYGADTGLRFDALFLRAEALGRLPFALSPATRAEPARIDGRHATAVLRTPGAPDLTLALVELPSGRWKLDRIHWPGSDAAARPWGAQAAD